MEDITFNKNGVRLPAIPEPYYCLIRKKCDCGRKFWSYKAYVKHYIYKHIYHL